MLLGGFSSQDIKRLRLWNKRIYLRAPKRSDWQEWAALRRASEDFLSPWEPTWASDSLSKASFRDKLRLYRHDWQLGVSYTFYIFKRDHDMLLGGITLGNIRRGAAHMGTVGYWMGAEFAGQGYMSEALSTVVDYGFEDLGLHRIEAACLPHNEASKRVLRKVGFSEEGLARGYLRINAQWQDHVTFGILRSDPRLSRTGWVGGKKQKGRLPE